MKTPVAQRQLPKHIMRFRDGFRIRIVRGDLTYQAVTRDLTRAIELRDNFLRIAGPIRLVMTPRSNTGLLGISETVTWRHERRYECFVVSRARKTARIYFTPDTRAEALKRAIAARKEMEAAHA